MRQVPHKSYITCLQKKGQRELREGHLSSQWVIIVIPNKNINVSIISVTEIQTKLVKQKCSRFSLYIVIISMCVLPVSITIVLTDKGGDNKVTTSVTS